MKVVVVGGTGLIGTKLVARLRERGHEAVVASPKAGVDAVTGAGLSDAFTGAEIVVDVSNPRSFADHVAKSFFETSTQTLLAAGRAAGVRHHVVLSVVGAERLAASGYFRGKLNQERLTQQSGIAHSIVQATQFFEFARMIARASTQGGSVCLPAILVQPLAADDVASALCSIALSSPRDGVVQLAGPGEMRIDAFVRQSLEAASDPRTVVVDPHARYFGIQVQERTLLPEGKCFHATTTFEHWLEASTTRASS